MSDRPEWDPELYYTVLPYMEIEPLIEEDARKRAERQQKLNSK